jgi:DNA-binding NarL/FixJ family response regulator
MKTPAVKILIIEHFPVVSAGIRLCMSETPYFTVVGDATTIQEGLRLIHTVAPDIVLLDIGMPKKNGYEALMAIKAAHANLPVLIITSELEQFYASQMISNGAHGYFQKHGDAGQLSAAMREIFDNKADKNQKTGNAIKTEKPLHEQLSAREYEVFYSLCKGEKPSETANKLALSPTTISKYRKRVLEKMRMRSVPDLIRYAIYQKIDFFHH